MSLVTCGGADVMRCRIHLPSSGLWSAELSLDVGTVPTGSVTLAAIDGFELAGFVDSGGAFLDSAHVRVIGGAGGLRKVVDAAAYQNAQLRDPLSAVLNAVGEKLSGTVDSALLSVSLPHWDTNKTTATRILTELCGAATKALGKSIDWRVLEDGTVWLGAETWPSVELGEADDVLETFPAEGRYVIGVQTPTLLPGVNLSGVGNVIAVDHWISPGKLRTWAWTA